MPISCDRCSSLNKCCVVSDKSIAKACSECVLAKKGCSFSVVSFPQAGLEKFLRERERLEKEKESVASEEQQLFERLVQVRAKARRLEKQSRLLHERGGRLIQEGIESLEQLEALGEAECACSDNPPLPSFASGPTASFSVPGVSDLASPGFWESPGVFENPLTPPVHSRDVQ